MVLKRDNFNLSSTFACNFVCYFLVSDPERSKAVSQRKKNQNFMMGPASQRSNLFWFVALLFTVGASLVGPANGQLSTNFYGSSCPSFLSTVNSALIGALSSDGRVGASLLRVFFHDCFVQGCDGSVLLDDTSSFQGEKTATPNLSLRGFEVVDGIKTTLEANCPQTISCADILAVLARDAVVLAGGPSWGVQLGRRDSTTANLALANNNLPAPTLTAAQLISTFTFQGLSTTDMVALSGAHTFGKAQCSTFSDRLFNFGGTGAPDPSIDPTFLATLQAACPQGTNGLVDLDQGTPGQFDSQYYNNLLIGRGLLTSDQTLSNSGQTSGIVTPFTSQAAFFSQFVASMIRMGQIGVLTGSQGEIRTQCRFVNS